MIDAAKQCHHFELVIRREAGYEEGCEGVSYNKNAPLERMPAVVEKLAHAGPGHEKCLRFMMVWFTVDAPRYWWSEADTYGVGMVKSSESTMFTISSRLLNQDDFVEPIPDELLTLVNEHIVKLQNKQITIAEMKRIIPEGFLQKRMCCCSYLTLKNIYEQRKTHRLPEWIVFCDELLKQLEHPEFIEKGYIKP